MRQSGQSEHFYQKQLTVNRQTMVKIKKHPRYRPSSMKETNYDASSDDDAPRRIPAPQTSVLMGLNTNTTLSYRRGGGEGNAVAKRQFQPQNNRKRRPNTRQARKGTGLGAVFAVPNRDDASTSSSDDANNNKRMEKPTGTAVGLSGFASQWMVNQSIVSRQKAPLPLAGGLSSFMSQNTAPPPPSPLARGLSSLMMASSQQGATKVSNLSRPRNEPPPTSRNNNNNVGLSSMFQTEPLVRQLRFAQPTRRTNRRTNVQPSQQRRRTKYEKSPQFRFSCLAANRNSESSSDDDTVVRVHSRRTSRPSHPTAAVRRRCNQNKKNPVGGDENLGKEEVIVAHKPSQQRTTRSSQDTVDNFIDNLPQESSNDEQQQLVHELQSYHVDDDNDDRKRGVRSPTLDRQAKRKDCKPTPAKMLIVSHIPSEMRHVDGPLDDATVSSLSNDVSSLSADVSLKIRVDDTHQHIPNNQCAIESQVHPIAKEQAVVVKPSSRQTAKKEEEDSVFDDKTTSAMSVASPYVAESSRNEEPVNKHKDSKFDDAAQTKNESPPQALSTEPVKKQHGRPKTSKKQAVSCSNATETMEPRRSRRDRKETDRFTIAQHTAGGVYVQPDQVEKEYDSRSEDSESIPNVDSINSNADDGTIPGNRRKSRRQRKQTDFLAAKGAPKGPSYSSQKSLDGGAADESSASNRNNPPANDPTKRERKKTDFFVPAGAHRVDDSDDNSRGSSVGASDQPTGKQVAISVQEKHPEESNVPIQKRRIKKVKRKVPILKQAATTAASTDDWSLMQVQQLHDAHRTVKPTSTTFWEDIALFVNDKSSHECRTKWFSYVKTPAAKVSKKAAARDSIDEDDLFKATPMREFRLPDLGRLSISEDRNEATSSTENAPQAKANDRKPQQYQKKGYKKYLDNMRRDVQKAEKLKLKQKTKKVENKSLVVRENEFNLNVKLTPGGTLKMNHSEGDLLEDYYDSDEEMMSLDEE